MDNDRIRDEIARLEGRIAMLSDSLERCRKVAVAARVVLAVGGLWTALMFAGALEFGRFNLVGAIVAVLGGIVLAGSNASTARQTETVLATAEAQRADLIGQMDLSVVGEKRTLH